MVDREDRDWVHTAGTILIAVGVSMWIVYAVGRYLLGWDITDREFLPYHLATILPGMVLRYHRFFFDDLPARFLRGREKRLDQRRTTAANSQGAFLKVSIIINNFAHDLSTGLWASSLLVISLLDRKARSLDGVLISSMLHDVMRVFFWIGVASIGAIFATGGLRLLYYRTESAEEEKLKKELLIVKHVLFTFVFIGGTYYAYLHAFGSERL